MKETITIKNRIEELPVLAAKVEELAEIWELPMPLAMNINLVLEEAVSNVIFYAYSDKEEHTIDLDFIIENKVLTISIIDNGNPFDPTLQKQPDISLPAEERPIGGLGIFLINKIMDEVTYQRIEGNNVLKLVKKIHGT